MLRIANEQKKSVLIYLVTMVLVILCILLLRSSENTLELSIQAGSGKDEGATVINYSPKLSLPKGIYELKLSGESGAGEATITSDDGAVYGNVPISESGATMAIALDRDVSNLTIQTSSDDVESVPNFTKARVTSAKPIFSDSILLAFLALLGFLAIGYIKYIVPEKNRTNAILFVVVTGTAILASYPIFTNYLYSGHDINFHLWRIEGIKDGLLSGQFPVRIHPTHNSGYGYITASVYPELFLYFPAILRLLGVSSVMAYKVFVFAMNFATAWIMYHVVHQMSGSKNAAGIASVVYTLSTWRLLNVFHRAAVGEALFMTFFPLVVLGLYYILKGNKSKWYVLAIACTCVFQSHIIGTLMTAVFMIAMFLIFIRDLFREKHILALCKAGILTVLLNLWYLVPFVYYYFSLDMKVRNTSANTTFYGHSIIPAELFNVTNKQFGISNLLSSGVRGEMSLSLGVGISLCLVAGVLYYLFNRKKTSQESMEFSLFAIGLASIYMATSLFPWEAFQKYNLINKFAATLQFPWRFLSVASVLIGVAGAIAISKWTRGNCQRSAFIAIWIVCALSVVSFGAAYTNNYDVYIRKGMAVPGAGSSGTQKEYFLVTTNPDALASAAYHTSDESMQVSGYEKRGTNITLNVSGATDGAYVEVPLLYYAGYAAKDESNQRLEVVSGNNDVLRVMVKENTSEIRISYQGLPIFKPACIASVLTLALFLAWLYVNRRKRRLQAL